MFEQTVQPRLDVTSQAGLCLWFAQEVFGVPHKYNTAWQAYQATQFRHANRNFPPGVAVPVWFNWWGQLPGDSQKHQYGHAAVRAADGRIYSSPLSGQGRAVFGSVDELANLFGGGMQYVGWSEDISGVKVIENKEDKMMQTEDDVRLAMMAVEHKTQVTPEDIRAWTGQPFTKYLSEAVRNNLWLTQNHYITFFTDRDKTVQEQAAQIEALKAEKGSVDAQQLEKLYEALGRALGK